MSIDKFEAWANSTEEGKKASFYWSHKEYEDSAYAAWLAGRESMRDEAADKFWSAQFGDLEHGVKWINERKSQEFIEKYPLISEFGEWINKVKP